MRQWRQDLRKDSESRHAESAGKDGTGEAEREAEKNGETGSAESGERSC